jgi:hypothetical protein
MRSHQISTPRIIICAISIGHPRGFHILAFSIDGDPVGSGFWERSKLSAQWIEVCARELATGGSEPAIQIEWNGNLSHIRTSIASAEGTAMVSFLVNDIITASAILMAGSSAPAERAASQMWVDSLRRSNIVLVASSSSNPFEQVLTTNERPLLVVIPWPDARVSEQDRELVRELLLHLARAYFDNA